MRLGCKWFVRVVVDYVESLLEIDIFSNICIGRKGIGVVYFY